VLTSNDDDDSIVESLDKGANDYLVKPISKPHLLARVRGTLKRNKKNEVTKTIKINDVDIDLTKLKVFKNNQIISLTHSEFKLLSLFSQHPEKAFNRKELAEFISEDEEATDSNIIDVHIHSLRKKLQDKKFIATVRGIGYRLGVSITK
jgi:DNA-binding response OmpR family regulator